LRRLFRLANNGDVRGVSNPANRSFYAGVAWVVVLAIVGLLPALFGPWILDDGPLIVTNPRIHELTAANLRFLLTHDMWDLELSVTQTRPHLVYFRPLVMLSYALDWRWGGGGSVAFHVTNALLHVATILLAARALLRWSGSRGGALLAAAYFGLHPARAESAAWISGRPDVLAMLGLLVCLEGVVALRKGLRGVVLFVMGLVVAFGSKETGVLLPLLVVIELAASARSGAVWTGWRAWPLAATLAAAGCYLLARQLWLPMRPFPIEGLAPLTHVGFVFETLGRAAMFMLAPFDLSLSGAMLTERAGRIAPESHYLLLGVASSLVLLAALIWARRHDRRAFWALLAFVISLVPTLNLVWIGGIGLTAARFFYLPSLLLAWCAIELGRGRFQAVKRSAATVLTYAIAAVLTLLLALQSANFQSEDQFWVSELRTRPDVPANIEHFIQRDWERGEPDRALARSLCEYQIAAERFSFMGAGARIILETLDRWARLLPDERRTELSAIADFLAVAREPSGPAVLRLGFVVDVPPQSRVRRELVARSAEVQTQEAAIRVRLGQPHRSLELVRAARLNCPRCHDLLERQAYVAYQAFDANFAAQLARESLDRHWDELPNRAALDRLRALNDDISQASGTKRLQLQVQRLYELKLYGEGLRVLRQAQRDAQDGASDPSLLPTMLRLAALAGDGPLTERLAQQLDVPALPLSRQPSHDRIEGYLRQLHDGCAFPEELQ
jgi:hypothetical protein